MPGFLPWFRSLLCRLQVIMFTSDVSARGVDYPNVSLVIQVCTRSALDAQRLLQQSPEEDHTFQYDQASSWPLDFCASFHMRGAVLHRVFSSATVSGFPTAIVGKKTLNRIAELSKMKKNPKRKLNLVRFQVGMPADKAQYIHRVGRTARAGKQASQLGLRIQDDFRQDYRPGRACCSHHLYDASKP